MEIYVLGEFQVLGQKDLELVTGGSAGGTTLPPWPSKETDTVSFSAGGGTLPPWPPKETDTKLY